MECWCCDHSGSKQNVMASSLNSDDCDGEERVKSGLVCGWLCYASVDSGNEAQGE